jgi:carnitine O-octanoyltransferase
VPQIEYIVYCFLYLLVKPHVSDDEYRQTEFVVQQFASGVGKDLHRKLLDKARTEKNWVSLVVSNIW